LKNLSNLNYGYLAAALAPPLNPSLTLVCHNGPYSLQHA